MKRDVTGYSSAQVALHWAIVLLVLFQLFSSDAMATAWRALARGEAMPVDATTLAWSHAGAGVAILLLALARIWLRVTRGAPRPPEGDPRALQVAADAVHGLLYLLILLVPLSGAVAWFGGVSAAAGAHLLLKNALLIVVLVHIGAALFQHFVRRTDVLMRMLRPQRD